MDRKDWQQQDRWVPGGKYQGRKVTDTWPRRINDNRPAAETKRPSGPFKGARVVENQKMEMEKGSSEQQIYSSGTSARVSNGPGPAGESSKPLQQQNKKRKSRLQRDVALTSSSSSSLLESREDAMNRVRMWMDDPLLPRRPSVPVTRAEKQEEEKQAETSLVMVTPPPSPSKADVTAATSGVGVSLSDCLDRLEAYVTDIDDDDDDDDWQTESSDSDSLLSRNASVQSLVSCCSARSIRSNRTEHQCGAKDLQDDQPSNPGVSSLRHDGKRLSVWSMNKTYLLRLQEMERQKRADNAKKQQQPIMKKTMAEADKDKLIKRLQQEIIEKEKTIKLQKCEVELLHLKIRQSQVGAKKQELDQIEAQVQQMIAQNEQRFLKARNESLRSRLHDAEKEMTSAAESGQRDVTRRDRGVQTDVTLIAAADDRRDLWRSGVAGRYVRGGGSGRSEEEEAKLKVLERGLWRRRRHGRDGRNTRLWRFALMGTMLSDSLLRGRSSATTILDMTRLFTPKNK